MAQEVNRKLKPQEPHERKGPALSVGHSRVVNDDEDAETEVWPTRLIWQGIHLQVTGSWVTESSSL